MGATAHLIEASGTGTNVGVGIGYNIANKIALEANLNYFMGKDHYNQSNGIYRSKLFLFIPSIVFISKKDKIKLYDRLGFLIGVGRFQENFPGSSYNPEKLTSIFTGGSAVGGTNALGLKIKLNDRLSLFGETAINLIVYKSRKVVDTFQSAGLPDNIFKSKSNAPFDFLNLGLNAGLIFSMSKNKPPLKVE